MPDDQSLEPLIDQICDRFDTAWRSGKQPKVSLYAREIGDDGSEAHTRRRLLIELIRVDMDYRAQRGDIVFVREYLREFPELIGTDGAPPHELLFGQEDTLSAHELDTRVPPKVDGAAESRPCLEDYEIISEIARGGMGVVYKARDTQLKCDVALKTIRSGQFAGREEIERFRREAEAAAQLQHPGIVRIHRIGQSQGLHYFTMDFVDGQSLAQVVKAGPLKEQEAIRFTTEICEAVVYAHQRGILHRDIKPSNVLVNPSGHALITDFGLAKRLEEESDFSHSGQALGTPGYMPPEQALGRKEDIDIRSDVYSIGALLYHLLTGRPPFQGASQAEVIHKVLNTEPTGPHKFNSKISRDLNTICMKCLEKDPARRYMSAAELRVDLQRLMNGFPIHARPVGFIENGWRWYRRHTMVANLLLATCLAVGIGAAMIVAVKRESFQSRLYMAKQRVEAEIATARAKESLSHGNLRPELVGIESDRLSESLQVYASVVSERRLPFNLGTTDPEFQKDLADLLFFNAQTTRLLHDFHRSKSSFLSAIKKYDDLRLAYPSDQRFPLSLGISCDYLGELYRVQDRVEDADRHYRRSIEVLEQCLDDFPGCDEARLELARANNNYGILIQEMNRTPEAEVHFKTAETVLRVLVDRNGKNVNYRRDLARSLINLGRLKRIQKDYDRAEELYLEATAGFTELLRSHPKSERYKFLSAVTKMNHGFMQTVYMEDLEGGETRLREALSEFSELPTNIPEYRFTKAKCLLNICQLYGLRYNKSQIADDLAGAEEFCVAAHELFRELHAAHTDVAEFDSWMGVVLGTLGWISEKKNNYDTFVKYLVEAIRFQRDAVAKRPRHRNYKSRLEGHQSFLVTNLLAAMDRGFQPDFSDSRFDPVRDDPDLQALSKVSSLMGSKRTEETIAVLDDYIANGRLDSQKAKFRTFKFQVLVGDKERTNEASEYALALLADESLDATSVNNIARTIYQLAESDRMRSDELLKAALDVSLKAVDDAGRTKLALLDTIAHLQHQLGDREAALETQRSAIEAADPADKGKYAEFLDQLEQEIRADEKKSEEVPRESDKNDNKCMSPYQYIYFAAVDRALDDKQLAYMRRQSTRAEVTRWQFENEYHYAHAASSLRYYRQNDPRCQHSRRERRTTMGFPDASGGSSWFYLRAAAHADFWGEEVT